MTVVIGTAGWTIARSVSEAFPDEGSSLERYSARFRGVEVNSSFHRPHRPSTWARWAASSPDDFRFAVKLPKTITHQAKLAGCEALVATFLREAGALGEKLAVLLVQLPPKLAFDRALAERFFANLKEQAAACAGKGRGANIVCEPRHPGWFDGEADDLLGRIGVARVAADPAIVPAAAAPGGWRDLAYWRLHGSPIVYRSAYGAERIADYAGRLEASTAAETWCMFDNTASSAATADALTLAARLQED